jgi:hypothetical protein
MLANVFQYQSMKCIRSFPQRVPIVKTLWCHCTFRHKNLEVELRGSMFNEILPERRSMLAIHTPLLEKRIVQVRENNNAVFTLAN